MGEPRFLESIGIDLALSEDNSPQEFPQLSNNNSHNHA